jgi:hypothetical protein
MGLTYKIENVERKLLDKITCDRCAKNIEKISEGGWNQFGEPHSMFHEPGFAQFFLLKQQWGYGSKKDGQIHEAVLCEPCYDEVFKGVNLAVTNDWRFDGLEEGYGIESDTSSHGDREGA